MPGRRPATDSELIADNRELQQRLHGQNQRRFEQIEKNQDKQGEVLQEVLENTRDLSKLKDDVSDIKEEITKTDLSKLKTDVEEIQADRNKAKGAVKIASLMGAGSLVGEALHWLIFHK